MRLLFIIVTFVGILCPGFAAPCMLVPSTIPGDYPFHYRPYNASCHWTLVSVFPRESFIIDIDYGLENCYSGDEGWLNMTYVSLNSDDYTANLDFGFGTFSKSYSDDSTSHSFNTTWNSDLADECSMTTTFNCNNEANACLLNITITTWNTGSPLTSTPVPIPTVKQTNTTSSTGVSTLGPSWIIWILVIGVLGVLTMIILVCFFYRKSNYRKSNAYDEFV